MCLRLLVVAGLALSAALSGLTRRPKPPTAQQAWEHNVGVMHRRCRQMVPWATIVEEFAQTVQYDDVEAHKACERARRRGCRHGPCTRQGGAGCLNRAGTRCCDARLKRCVNLS